MEVLGGEGSADDSPRRSNDDFQIAKAQLSLPPSLPPSLPESGDPFRSSLQPSHPQHLCFIFRALSLALWSSETRKASKTRAD